MEREKDIEQKTREHSHGDLRMGDGVVGKGNAEKVFSRCVRMRGVQFILSRRLPEAAKLLFPRRQASDEAKAVRSGGEKDGSRARASGVRDEAEEIN